MFSFPFTCSAVLVTWTYPYSNFKIHCQVVDKSITVSHEVYSQATFLPLCKKSKTKLGPNDRKEKNPCGGQIMASVELLPLSQPKLRPGRDPHFRSFGLLWRPLRKAFKVSSNTPVCTELISVRVKSSGGCLTSMHGAICLNDFRFSSHFGMLQIHGKIILQRIYNELKCACYTPCAHRIKAILYNMLMII